MKKANSMVWVAAAFLLAACGPARAAKQTLPPISRDPYIGAIVVDAATGEVLREDNANRPGYPASMTKLMNLFVTLDAVREGRVSLTDNVRVSHAAYSIGASQVWLDPHESFPLEELLYAMMIHSANDAAYLVAEHVGGSASAFVRLMNEKARALGLSPVTSFVSPHGLPPDEGRPDMTTPADCAKLCVALLHEHPEALSYTSVPRRTFRPESPFGYQPIDMVNRNPLIGKFPGCDGLKTGYFKRAGFSVAATAERDGRRAIAVILGSVESRTRDRLASEWLEYGLQHASKAAPKPAVAEVQAPAAAPDADADPALEEDEDAGAADGDPAPSVDDAEPGKSAWPRVLGWLLAAVVVGGIVFLAVKRRLLVSQQGNVRVRK